METVEQAIAAELEEAKCRKTRLEKEMEQCEKWFKDLVKKSECQHIMRHEGGAMGGDLERCERCGYMRIY